jgi:hypothetical protein
MFANAKSSEEIYTPWLDEAEAFQRVKKEVAKRNIYPAWIGWSYFYGHNKYASDVKLQLKELAETMIKSYLRSSVDTFDGRSMFKELRDNVVNWRLRRNRVHVEHLEGESPDDGYGFAYARCTTR